MKPTFSLLFVWRIAVFKSVKSCLEVKTSRNQSKFSFIVFFLQFNFLLSSSSSYSRLKWRCKKIWSDDSLKSKLAFTSVSSSFLNVSLSLVLLLFVVVVCTWEDRVSRPYRSLRIRLSIWITQSNDNFAQQWRFCSLLPQIWTQSYKTNSVSNTIIVKIW